LSASLKGLVGITVAGVALAALVALAILAGLPGMAEAQEVEAQVTGAASMEAEQNTTTTTTTTTTTSYEKGAPAVWQPAPEPSTTRLVVEPGESLWSISEEHLGPGATPEQTAYEVNRIFELNRERIGEDPNLIFPAQEFVLVSPAPYATAPAIPNEPAVSEQPTVTAQLAPTPIVVESEGVSDPPVAENVAAEDGVSEGVIPTPQTPDSTDEQAENASAESVPAESVPSTTAAGGIAGSLLEVYDNIKVERRLLGIGILALTLIVAILMALRLPMRRNVEDPAAWGTPQDYYENYARPEPTLEASSETSPETSLETARKPEGEPSSSPASGAPPEEPTGGPATSTSGTNNPNTTSSPTGETEGALPVGAASAAAAARSRERLMRARHLRSIRQRRSPTSW
jgi:hypothetical protein